MKKLIVVMIMLVGFSTVGFASPKPYTMIQEHYMVVQGDTLDSIASNHIIKNTYGVREIKEFKEGIKELNPQLLQREVEPGEVININYWINTEG